MRDATEFVVVAGKSTGLRELSRRLRWGVCYRTVRLDGIVCDLLCQKLMATPLRILQIVHTTGYGGLERQVLELSLGLRDAGHTVVMALRQGSWLAKQADANGLPWEPIRFAGLLDPMSHFGLCRTIRRWGINIVHGHSRRSAFYSAMAARLTRQVSVATIHSLQTWKGFRRNSHMIAVSDAVRDFLVSKGLPADRVERIHNGVPSRGAMRTESRLRARQRLSMRPNCIGVAMAGRMVQHKGHDLLLEAVAALSKELPEESRAVQVFLVGDRVGQWPRDLERLAGALGLEERVHMLGYHDDVAPLLAAMDIFVQPSRSEALSLSMLEAMAAGLPVVATRTGGMPEVIEHGVNGLLFEPDDSRGLAAQLALLLEPGTRARLAREAKATQARRFAVPNMISATEGIYRRMLVPA